MAAFSARNARISFEDTWLLALKWTVNIKADELDVSNMESQGYADYIGGLWEADISFDAIVDSAVASNSFYIWPGKNTGTVTFYFDYSTNVPSITNNNAQVASATTKNIAFTSLFLSSVNIDAEVRGFLRMSVSAKNKGVFQMPSI